jgi:putative SOS response-associated peptidase YedK
MCGRYSFFTPLPEAEAALQVKAVPYEGWQPNYNGAPTQAMPVITNEFPGVMQFFRWGLVPSWAKEPSIGYKMINTRAESIMEKPAFRNIFKYRRCIVPADGYYEWQQPEAAQASKSKSKTAKQAWRFCLPDGGLMLMAGLWATWGQQGLQTFSIITCPANLHVQPIHHRMPVLLSYSEAKKWLSNQTSPAELLALLKPAPEDLLTAYRISAMVNNPANNLPQVIEPEAAN